MRDKLPYLSVAVPEISKRGGGAQLITIIYKNEFIILII